MKKIVKQEEKAKRERVEELERKTEEKMIQKKELRRKIKEKLSFTTEKYRKRKCKWQKNRDFESLSGKRSEGKRIFSVNGSHRWRKNCCIACLCTAPCSETSYGRSAEQVTEFLRDVIQPVLDANKEDLGQHVELNV